jgi:hypothetical protein
MTDRMPCGLEDDRVRFEPDSDEPVEVMTPMERRIHWVCDSWADALAIDTADEWQDMRRELFGAVQTLVYDSNRNEDRAAIMELQQIAFERTIECIREGKYAGAKK